MPANYLIGLLLLLQLAACTATKTPEPVAPGPEPVAITPPVTALVPSDTSVVAPPPPAPVAAPVSATPVISASAKVATPAHTPAPSTPQKAPAAAAQPPMALATLEQRLKDTDAIGVFTKIALKNQVDDLLSRARSHHQSNGNPTLAQLRQSYDQLLAKVHGLLKDGDPALANAITASREAIWTVLTDPVKFAKL